MAEPFIHDPTKEAGYFATRSGLYVAGKQIAEAVGEPMAEAIKQTVGPEIANNLGAAATFMGGTLPGLMTIGLAASVSAGLTQMDYQHKRDNLRDLYKEELAAKFNIAPSKVTNKEMDEAAKSNATLAEELGRAKKQRTFGVGMSLVATMAALSVVTFTLPAVVGALSLGLGTSGVTWAAATLAGKAMLTGITGFGIKAITGLATYHVVKDPLHYIADKLFGLDDKTTNDHIIAIKKGRAAGKMITREEVLSTFVAANPQLDRFIVNEYGKHFDDLNQNDKSRAASDLNKLIPLDKLTFDINTGKINPTELAFAVQGEISGVDHSKQGMEQPKRGLIGTMLKGVRTALGFKESQSMETASASVMETSTATAVAFENPAPEQAFVQRLGLAAKSQSLSHVERLEQGRSSAEPAVSMQQT